MSKILSRQYKWQLKQLTLGKCVICGKTATTKRYCRKHAKKQNEYVKKHSLTSPN